MVVPRERLHCGRHENKDLTVFTMLMRAHAIALRTAREMLIETGVSPLEA